MMMNFANTIKHIIGGQHRVGEYGFYVDPQRQPEIREPEHGRAKPADKDVLVREHRLVGPLRASDATPPIPIRQSRFGRFNRLVGQKITGLFDKTDLQKCLLQLNTAMGEPVYTEQLDLAQKMIRVREDFLQNRSDDDCVVSQATLIDEYFVLAAATPPVQKGDTLFQIFDSDLGRYTDLLRRVQKLEGPMRPDLALEVCELIKIALCPNGSVIARDESTMLPELIALGKTRIRLLHADKLVASDASITGSALDNLNALFGLVTEIRCLLERGLAPEIVAALKM